MAATNKIHKYACSSTNKILYLKEYVLYEEENQDKYVLFNFYNNYSQDVHELEFEIKQYNDRKHLLDVSNFTYSNFNAKPKSSFVPYAKMMVSDDCCYIEAKLVMATFKKDKYIDGQIINLRKLANEERNKELVRERLIKPKFTSKKANGRNKIVKCLAFSIMLIIAAGIFILSYLHSNNMSNAIKSFSYNGYEYNVLNENSVEVSRYNGNEAKLKIADKIFDYNITGVGRCAFENSSIQSIEFSSSNIAIDDYAFNKCSSLVSIKAKNVTEIGQNAFSECSKLELVDFVFPETINSSSFENCESLKSINSTTVKNIKTRAFYGCTSLEEFNVPNATLTKSVLGVSKLQKVIYKDSNTTTFAEIFGTSNDQIYEYGISDIVCSMDTISKTYFNGLSSKINVDYPATTKIEHGAFSSNGYENYYLDDVIEVLNGELIAVSYNKESTFTLSGQFESIAPNVFASLNYVSNFTIDVPNFTIEQGFLDKMAQLKNLTVQGTTKLGENSLSRCSSLYYINIGVNSCENLAQALGENSSVKSVTVSGDSNIPNFYLSDLEYVERIIISSKITGIGYNAFNNCKSLKEIKMPYLGSLKEVGSLDKLEKIEFTDNVSLTTLKSNTLYNMTNLTEVTFPSNIVSSESNVIYNCDSIKSLIVPDNITCAYPFIGAGCESLTKVVISTLNGRYMDFNDSYQYTKELIINGEVSLTSNSFINCSIEKLQLNSKLDSSTELGFLSELNTLKYLSVNGLFGDCFASYFTNLVVPYNEQSSYIPSCLKTIEILYTSEIIEIPEGYFYNCYNLENVLVCAVVTYSVDSFSGLSNLKNFYSYSSVTSNLRICLNGTSFNNNVNLIVRNSSANDIYNSSIITYTNVDFSYHNYVVYVNNKNYFYYGLIIPDMEFLTNSIEVENEDYLLSTSSKGDFVSFPYFGQNGTSLYLLKPTSINVSAYIQDDIEVKFMDDYRELNSVVLTSGQTLDYYIPIKDNNLFVGWYTDQYYSKRFNFKEEITSDLTLYAKWQPLDSAQHLGANTVTRINSFEYVFVAANDELVELLFFGIINNIYIYENDDFTSGYNCSNNLKIEFSIKAGNVYKISLDFDPSVDNYIILLANSLYDYGSSAVAKPTEVVFTEFKIIGNYVENFDIPTKPGYVFTGWYDENGQLIIDADGNVVNSYSGLSKVYAHFS